MPVTTRIITFVGNPDKPSFATGILGGGTTQGIALVANPWKIFKLFLAIFFSVRSIQAYSFKKVSHFVAILVAKDS